MVKVALALLFVAHSLLRSVKPDCPMCDCLQRTVEEEYGWADAVFEARVLAVNQVPNRGNTNNAPAMMLVGFSFKGSLPSVVVVDGGIGGAGSCDFKFEVGRSYLIYADEHEDNGGMLLKTNHCTRTSERDSVSEDEWDQLWQLAR
jgi:hypothetical protein